MSERTLPKRLVNMFIKNVAAVGRPANKRRFLVVKSAESGDVIKEAMTFDDAMLGRRIQDVTFELSSRFGALHETLESIRASEEENKPAAMKTAVMDFVKSLQDSVPSMLDEVLDKSDSTEGEKDVTKVATLLGALDSIISKGGDEVADVKKKEGTSGGDPTPDPQDVQKSTAPDASVLRKLGNGIAALFGQTVGADEATIAELTKSDKVEPLVPKAVQEQLSKAEADNKALQERLAKAEEATAKLREEAELRKFADEVNEYKDIGLDPAKDAALLKSISEHLSEEQAARVREVFKSAVAAAKAGALFKEVGSGREGAPAGEGVDAVIEERISAVMAKAENKEMDRSRAREEVFRQDPSLYARWRTETAVRI